MPIRHPGEATLHRFDMAKECILLTVISRASIQKKIPFILQRDDVIASVYVNDAINATRMENDSHKKYMGKIWDER
jgi:hypothetical protein